MISVHENNTAVTIRSDATRVRTIKRKWMFLYTWRPQGGYSGLPALRPLGCLATLDVKGRHIYLI